MYPAHAKTITSPTMACTQSGELDRWKTHVGPCPCKPWEGFCEPCRNALNQYHEEERFRAQRELEEKEFEQYSSKCNLENELNVLMNFLSVTNFSEFLMKAERISIPEELVTMEKLTGQLSDINGMFSGYMLDKIPTDALLAKLKEFFSEMM